MPASASYFSWGVWFNSGFRKFQDMPIFGQPQEPFSPCLQDVYVCVYIYIYLFIYLLYLCIDIHTHATHSFPWGQLRTAASCCKQFWAKKGTHGGTNTLSLIVIGLSTIAALAQLNCLYYPKSWSSSLSFEFTGNEVWGMGHNIWGFPKMGVPQNALFIVETLSKWMIWEYPHFRNLPYSQNSGKLA